MVFSGALHLRNELHGLRARRQGVLAALLASHRQALRTQAMLPGSQRSNPEVAAEIARLQQAIEVLRGGIVPEPPPDRAAREAAQHAAMALQGESSHGLFDEPVAAC